MILSVTLRVALVRTIHVLSAVTTRSKAKGCRTAFPSFGFLAVWCCLAFARSGQDQNAPL